MKKIIVSMAVGLVLISTLSFGKSIEQTICFSQDESTFFARLGDGVILNGKKCKGKTLPQMNRAGWRLIQVIGGLNKSFGMVFEKIED